MVDDHQDLRMYSFNSSSPLWMIFKLNRIAIKVKGRSYSNSTRWSSWSKAINGWFQSDNLRAVREATLSALALFLIFLDMEHREAGRDSRDRFIRSLERYLENWIGIVSAVISSASDFGDDEEISSPKRSVGEFACAIAAARLFTTEKHFIAPWWSIYSSVELKHANRRHAHQNIW